MAHPGLFYSGVHHDCCGLILVAAKPFTATCWEAEVFSVCPHWFPPQGLAGQQLMPVVNEYVCLPLVWFITDILCNCGSQRCTQLLCWKDWAVQVNNVVPAAIFGDIQTWCAFEVSLLWVQVPRSSSKVSSNQNYLMICDKRNLQKNLRYSFILSRYLFSISLFPTALLWEYPILIKSLDIVLII